MPEAGGRVCGSERVTGASASDFEIAVIGMVCRFPGADSVEAFWENLRAGVESVSFFSDEELLAAGVSPEALRNPAYVRAGAVLCDVEHFDARFFGYTPREAQLLDPQHRLFLETSWAALESAGYDPGRHGGAIGVFGGASGSHWLLRVMSSPQLIETISPYQAVMASDDHLLAPRVAYKLDLNGPAVVVQSACSTSLVAVHMACQSLLAGECEMALAGGVSVPVPQRVGYLYEPDGILSSDGHCRAFDAGASGTVRGSGVGLVVLKRLADALQDGDAIQAVIKGSATNNDGARKVGFTAPGVEGQARVIRAALATADVGPEDISYLEAHGTGTALGDPVEVAALTEAFRGTGRRGYCAIGSVKTNIGHLDAAAGIAGLIKVVLMLKHRELVPSLHFERQNPRIRFEDTPFYVATRRMPWSSNGQPRRAGVSSFGIGGTNAHVVLQEAPPAAVDARAPQPEVLVLSARTETALERATDALAAHLNDNPDLPLADVAFTLRAGRRPFAHRRAVVCRDPAEGARALLDRDPQRVWTGVGEEGRPVAFLFSGQGAQHVGMARGLYEAEPAFRADVDACCRLLEPILGLDLRSLMYPPAGQTETAARCLGETRFSQPALFTVEHALARLWMSWGVVPEAMIGHSVGEYVAACLAGVLDRDEALAVIADRARLMQECPPGAMTAVALAVERVRPLLDGRLEVSVVNGPDACVVGGSVEEVEQLEARLGREGLTFGRVPSSRAFHSTLMGPALEPFAARMAGVRLQPPQIPFVSNLTGTWITAEQACDPHYWVRHLREPVRFSDGLGVLLEKPQRVLLEVGPAHTLVALARRRFTAGVPGLALPSLPHPRREEPDEAVFLQTAGRLWTAGVAVDWSPRESRRRRGRVPLPTYPFERERYGVDPAPPKDVTRPSPEAKLPVERWLYTPSWKRTEAPWPEAARAGDSWCVFADGGGLGLALVPRLRERGVDVTVVRPGPGFARDEADAFTVDPAQRGDYERLLDEMESRGGVPERFVHLWSVDGIAEGSMDRGVLSVLCLGQALGRRQNRETSLFVVTAETQDVLSSEPLSPLRAAVLGPCRVIPQEYPLLSCRTVDVIANDPSAMDLIAEQILAEVGSRSTDPTVAYRGRYRWVQTFEPIEPVAGASPAARLRPRGVYLVTGGLGKVGRALAGYLARTVSARLVLTGRSGLPDRALWDGHLAGASAGDALAERIHAVRELEALGAEVLVVRADAADTDEMQKAIALTRERFGRLDGVIHAAGEAGPEASRSLFETDRGALERQLRPKLRGAEILDDLLGNGPIDFVLMTSSLSAALGGLGLAAYAAANHALDGYARRQHQRGKAAWTSVAWDAWSFEPDGLGRLARLAILPLEGGEALAHVLALRPTPHVVISTTWLDQRLEQWTRRAELAAPTGGASPCHPRPQMSAPYVAAEEAVERRLAAVWGEMLGIDRVGVDDNFFELGGDSLLAVHLMGRLRKEYAVELSVATLFEGSTVRALSRIIRSRQSPDPRLARSAGRGQARKQTRKEPRQRRRASDAAVE
jgi:acyl transferase domain-containing protein